MDKVSELIVGDTDCTYKDVVNALLTPATSVIVANEWRKLARALQLTDLTINEFDKQQALENKKIDDILHYILAKWRASIGNKATLGTLVSGVTAIGWQNVADKLKVTFENVEQSNTLQVKEPLTAPISYYVQRKLTTRSLLHREIFNDASKNIFVYVGEIEQYQVTKLANGDLTDSSRNQVYQADISVKHILLEQLGDWEQLRKMAVNPIHLIHCHFDEENFRWIESKGDVGLPQKFVKLREEQDKYREDEFQKFVLENKIPLRRKLPIIIADSPGMGKSVLLSQIAQSLKDNHENLQIIFIVIGDFVREVLKKLVCVRSPTDKHKLSAIPELLSNYFSDPNSALQMLTSSGSHNNITRLEILFDGFDEIDENDFELAYECLSMITELKPDIRLWVTTRPHFMHKLEQRLGVPGYNIIPFTRVEQEGFLKNFWSKCQKSELDLDNVKLQRFINGCLDKLASLLHSKENKCIAEIPLQCMLLAEAFEREAIEFADRENEAIDFNNKMCQININNITDMYKRLIDNRFQKYLQNLEVKEGDTHRLMEVHVHFALTLLFPQCHALLETLLKGKEYITKVLNVGILEIRSDDELPRFIHRTVAEYFVSFFVVNQLSSVAKFNSRPEELKHLVHLALETRSSQTFLNQMVWINVIDSFTFKHPAICHFINCLLSENQELPKEAVIQSLFSAPDENQILQVLHASLSSHCFCICKMLHKIIPQIWHNHDLMTIVVLESSVEFLRFLYSSLKDQLLPLCEFDSKDVPGKMTMLHFGVKRGDFYMVDYLLRHQGFANLVKSNANSMINLIHHCVFSTINAPAVEIQQRIQIMRIVLEEDSQLLHYKDEDGKCPILCPTIHVDLLIKMVGLGANLFDTDTEGNPFLHVVAAYLSDADLCKLLSSIPAKTLKVLIKSENRVGETILHILSVDFHTKINAIKFLLNENANPKAQTKEGLSVLALALSHLHSSNSNELESLLAVLGVTFTDALHKAASVGNLKAMEYFISTKNLDINSRNAEGKTPFESVLCGKKQELKRYDVANFLKAHHAVLDPKNEGCKLLHERILKGDTVGVKILLELCGMDTNSKSDSGCTSLQLIFESAKCSRHVIRSQIAELLLKHGANVNSQNLQGESPLEYAIRHHPDALNFEVFQLLVDSGINISEAVAGALLLWFCVQRKTVLTYENIIKYLNRLLQCSKSPIPVIMEGDNKFDFKNKSVIDYLLQQDWNISSVDDCGRSLLYYALQFDGDGGVSFLKYLLDLGVNPQLKTNNGSTLLHTCASLGRFFELKYLLKFGQLDINAADDDGDSPLHCAVDAPEHKSKVTELLLESGADSTVLNKKGETPRDKEVRQGADHKTLLLFDAKRRKLEAEKS